MMYKVWLHIEAIDECKDFYQEVGLPTQVGEYETAKEAEDVVNTIIDSFGE